jgi:hypothetical protein
LPADHELTLPLIIPGNVPLRLTEADRKFPVRRGGPAVSVLQEGRINAKHAEGFWEVSRDHTVNQNIAA